MKLALLRLRILVTINSMFMMKKIVYGLLLTIALGVGLTAEAQQTGSHWRRDRARYEQRLDHQRQRLALLHERLQEQRHERLLAQKQEQSTAKRERPRGDKQERMASMRERVRAEKRAYLIQHLELTEKEADGVMSILNELDEKRFQLWREGEALGGRVRKSDKTLTDEELNTFLEQSLSARIKEAELEKAYYLRCRTVLPVQKAVRLPHVCRAFARRFFEQHKH